MYSFVASILAVRACAWCQLNLQNLYTSQFHKGLKLFLNKMPQQFLGSALLVYIHFLLCTMRDKTLKEKKNEKLVSVNRPKVPSVWNRGRQLDSLLED